MEDLVGRETKQGANGLPEAARVWREDLEAKLRTGFAPLGSDTGVFLRKHQSEYGNRQLTLTMARGYARAEEEIQDWRTISEDFTR